MVTPACSFSRSFWLFREWGVFFPWHDCISTSPILSAVPWLFMRTLCSSSIQVSFRGNYSTCGCRFAISLGRYEFKIFPCCHLEPSLSSSFPSFCISLIFFFWILYFLLLCYLLISSNVGFGKHFSIYIIYHSIQQIFFEFLLSSRNSHRLAGGGLLENLARGHSLYFKYLWFL